MEFAAVDLTVNLCCFLVSSGMTNRVDGNISYPPSQMKDYVKCDQAKQTFNQMCFFSLQKRKQAVPVKIMQQSEKMILDDEIKMLEKTVMRKDLSTSTDTQGMQRNM